MANNNFSSSDFMMSNLYRGNLNTNTRNRKMKVKMGDPLGMPVVLQMTSTGNGPRNPTLISRRCLTEADILGDEVDDDPDSYYLRGLDALEEVDLESEDKGSFVQQWWKAVTNSPAYFLEPLTQMLEPVTSSDATSKLVKISAKTALFLAKLYLGKNKKDPREAFFDKLVGLDVPKHQMKMIKSRILGSGGSNKTIPAGVLLYGPPGTGKTSLAHALAREVNASFLPVAGEKLAANEKGVGRLTSLLQRRDCLMSQIDKCKADGAMVIVVATTESPSQLKERLQKKFEKSFGTEMPDLKTRERMVDVLLKEVKVDEEEKKSICQFLAYKSDGFVWGDLERVCIEAGVLAKYEGGIRPLVRLRHISESLMEVKANKGLIEADKEKKKTKKKAKKTQMEAQKETEGSTAESKN
ncbi:hypothetical protein CTI12_AA467410 [Artemisia annua]|uniref:ATPase AAA-type core domain-containing protein n=1 Tax=Artemisia annua TaxID=35608 RepID=A0A2U1LJS5_ARTAN|nr:hypothetical protein CTI12_AA467410 [Artemisia annua]